MRLAEVMNGVVVNIIEVNAGAPLPDFAENWPEIGATGGPGWLYDGKTFTPPAEPPLDRAAMPVLSRAQLLAGLVLVQLITRAEMRAANSAVPAAVQAALDTLPVQRAVIFEARWLNFTEAHRTNDLVALLQAQAQLTDARTDELWLEWAAIP
jgi:hypothetical protein